MVVSNTSPIINLAAIGLLDLLPQVYVSIAIPQAVYTEITVAGKGKTGSIEVQQASWIMVYNVTNRTLVTNLLREVNPGEAESIALSIEQSARLLLIDERRGRTLAMAHGIAVTGILGVLSLAKGQGLLVSVKPALDDLRRSGFWVDERLYRYILQQVGEV